MIENLVFAFIVVLSLALAIIALMAFRRARKAKILFVAIAFVLFFIKGILFSVQLSTEALNEESLLIGSGLLDIGILLTIFLATLKR
jgi:hypothetical protein